MQRVAKQLRGRCPRGFTLVELGVAVVIIGILVTMVVPSFLRVTEQNKVDAAAQYLRSIWSAERIYWLEHRTFTDQLSDLSALGLIDAKIAAGSDGFYAYSISAATSTTFTVNAARNGSDVWTGTLHINQDGDVTGFVGGSNSVVLLPPDI
jgi:type IV pilus assembly protein PilE